MTNVLYSYVTSAALLQVIYETPSWIIRSEFQFLQHYMVLAYILK